MFIVFFALITSAHYVIKVVNYFRALGCVLSAFLLSACTGYNSLYPRFVSYEGADSAVIFVKDDSYNQAIYTTNLTDKGCFEVDKRRLLTRNMVIKGSGDEIYEYKVKAGQHYIIRNQSVRFFHYRTFIPELNVKYGISSGVVVKIPYNKNKGDLILDDFNTRLDKSNLAKGWSINDVCKGIFGSTGLE